MIKWIHLADLAEFCFNLKWIQNRKIADIIKIVLFWLIIFCVAYTVDSNATQHCFSVCLQLTQVRYVIIVTTNHQRQFNLQTQFTFANPAMQYFFFIKS